MDKNHQFYPTRHLVHPSKSVLESSAQFSPCRRYRYALFRRLSTGSGTIAFIGLNPSTADETHNDPTVRRCIGFAADWNYERFYMLNLFAFRATEPQEMKQQLEPTGDPLNLGVILEVAALCDELVLAWGTHGTWLERDEFVLEQLREAGAGRKLSCLGRNQSGGPKHPLYVRRDSQRIWFSEE